MWEAIAFGLLAAFVGVFLTGLAYWYFVIAPQFEAFRRELETARGEWAAYIRSQAPVQTDLPALPLTPDVVKFIESQFKRHAATSEDEEAA